MNELWKKYEDMKKTMVFKDFERGDIPDFYMDMITYYYHHTVPFVMNDIRNALLPFCIAYGIDSTSLLDQIARRWKV